jgi:hypothetical protein
VKPLAVLRQWRRGSGGAKRDGQALHRDDFTPWKSRSRGATSRASRD